MLNHTANSNEPLAEAARALTDKRAWAEKLLAHIEAIRMSRGANRSKEITRLETEILFQLDPENNESLIDAKVKESNIDFIKRANKRFPQLSEKELLLCAYIRMNFNSKTIASMKGIDSKSLNMARYRLKKKLGLVQKDDLEDYLRSLWTQTSTNQR